MFQACSPVIHSVYTRDSLCAVVYTLRERYNRADPASRGQPVSLWNGMYGSPVTSNADPPVAFQPDLATLWLSGMIEIRNSPSPATGKNLSCPCSGPNAEAMLPCCHLPFLPAGKRIIQHRTSLKMCTPPQRLAGVQENIRFIDVTCHHRNIWVFTTSASCSHTGSHSHAGEDYNDTHDVSGICNLYEVLEAVNAVSVQDPTESEAKIMMNLVRAKCDVYQAQKALADCVVNKVVDHVHVQQHRVSCIAGAP
ncbi:hypothetical protein C8R48DRAFT_669162 [Suillus tomentosus]|nr:hypothetical protein C8R48DRAFT_669162 [Suillus tomentosus]